MPTPGAVDAETKEQAVADEQDGPDATGDRGVTDSGNGRSTLTKPGSGPARPAGKRSRQRAAGFDPDTADDSADTKVIETATDSKTKRKPKRDAGEPSRNPFVFVFNYLQQVIAELRKVIWPNRKQMVTYTSVVFAFLTFMIALVAGADYAFAKLVLLVFGD